MNLFRSEEHISNWPHFDPATAEGILPLDDLVNLFSMDFCRRRMDENYVSSSGEYIQEFLSMVGRRGEKMPFWSME